MKKIIAGLLLVSSLVNVFGNDVIRLSTGEWPPYTTQNDAQGGILQKIVSEALSQENIDVKYEFFSWEKAYQVAKEVEFDGTIPLFKTAEREKDFIYSKNAITRTKTVFFHLKSTDFKWNKHEDLNNYKVGGTAGFKTAKILQDKGVKVDIALTEKENFEKLLAGDIEVTSSSYLVGYNIIKKSFSASDAAKFTSHPKKVYRATGVYFLVSKKHPKAQELVDKFDSGLKKLIKSGRYIKLIKESISK